MFLFLPLMFRTWELLAQKLLKIMDGHDLSVCKANAAKKGEATKKTKGLVSTNNYLAQDNMPRETDPLLWWKEKAAWNNGILLPLTPVVKKFSSNPENSCPREQAFPIVGQIIRQEETFPGKYGHVVLA